MGIYMSDNPNLCIKLIFIALALFILYHIIVPNNKESTGGDGEEENNIEETEISDLESDGPDYKSFENVINENDNEEIVQNELSPMQDNNVELMNIPNEEVSVEVAPVEGEGVAAPVEAIPVEAVPVEEAKPEYGVSGFTGEDDFFFIKNYKETARDSKLKPSELLPEDTAQLEGQNFLTAALAKSEQIVGVPTQIQRNRKNHDLRAAPPIKKVEVSPWNLSTFEADKYESVIEIGKPAQMETSE